MQTRTSRLNGIKHNVKRSLSNRENAGFSYRLRASQNRCFCAVCQTLRVVANLMRTGALPWPGGPP